MWVAEKARSFRHAAQQGAAGVGLAGDGIGCRFVASPQLHGVDIQRVGQLVHRGLHGEQVWRLGRPAHEARRLPVRRHVAYKGADVGAGVQPGGGVRPRRYEPVVARRELPGTVVQREEAPLRVGAEAEAVPGSGAEVAQGEALAPGRDVLDGAAETPGRQGHKRGVVPHPPPRAEAAAHHGGHDADGVGHDAELQRQPVLDAADVLRGLPHGQPRPVRIPGAGGLEQLHGVVVLRRRLVGGVHRGRGRCEPGGQVACRQLGFAQGRVGSGLLGAGVVEGPGGGCRLELAAQQPSPLVGTLRRVRDHDGDHLPGEADVGRTERCVPLRHVAAVLQARRPAAGRDGVAHVAPGQHLPHARHPARRGFVDERDPPPRDGRQDQRGVQGVAGRGMVGAVQRPARDLPQPLDPGRPGADDAVGLEWRRHAGYAFASPRVTHM